LDPVLPLLFVYFSLVLLGVVSGVSIGRYLRVLWVIIGGSLAALPPVLLADPRPLLFNNLQQTVVLEGQGEGYRLTERSRSIAVQLTNRLLVKTSSTLGADGLSQLDAGITKVQMLATLKDYDIWLVTLNHMNLKDAMKALARHESVIYVQPDILQTRQLTQQKSPRETEEKRTALPHQPAAPKSVRLAIIDDGFNFKHPEFARLNLLFEYDADQRREDAAPKQPADQHGTLVAGVIAAAADQHGIDGLAPDVELIAIRQVSTWTSDMLLAFSVARMMKADIVNSSWVLSFLPEPLFDLLTDWQQEQQPYLIFAAGNSQSDACEVNALSQLQSAWLIGALDKQGNRASYSNQGSCVSVYAPAAFSSTAASGQGYKPFGGTSAATAYVSGVLARELAAGRKPDKRALQQLLKN
jgi:subtilisin